MVEDRKQMKSGHRFSKWQKVKTICLQRTMPMGNKLVLGAQDQKGSETENTSYSGRQKGGVQLQIWKLDEHLYKQHLDAHSPLLAHSVCQSPPPIS